LNSRKVSTEDRTEILDLISEYAFSFDEDRIDEFVELFLDDAELSFYTVANDEPLYAAYNKAAILVLSHQNRSGPGNALGQPRHIQTSTLLKYISSDRISGRTLVVCTQQPYDGTDSKTLFTGVYEDEFQRTPQGWKFAIRRGRLDIQSYDTEAGT
jgi:hypothetical protein